MSIILVTGSKGGGQPHVTSAMDGIMHAGTLGTGGYLLKTRKWASKPVAKDSNHITIPAWDLILEGRQMMIDSATDVTIQSGSQGMKRADLIVARYALDPTTGVETSSLVALKGTATSGTPKDPAYNTGSIIGGAIVSDLPLCRVNLDGINITGIDTLVNVLAPLSEVWDSLTLSDWKTVSSAPSYSLDVRRMGHLVMMRVSSTYASGASWGTGPLGTLPEEFRPDRELEFPWSGRDNGSCRRVLVQKTGAVTYQNLGGSQNDGGWAVNGMWFV
ncbi:hypothetical protein [Bifidobacterium samirii]|uniref:Uncharacterized protein n=1 Tax=Bifidobacterium samirii TaxID=2306974 RepID=A0A430FUD1_9BIFI|nr:hypothetical protein [Bifidobacterium samirii]RSX56780.1 hypothetical protein D2E24_1070 [Bifidobacterium samirii]